MDDKIKADIDAMSYEQLLYHWRFSPIGTPLFQGEAGEYFTARMKALRSAPGGNVEHVRASRAIGWDD